MREIKFRAWHTNGDMFFAGDDFGTTHPLDCVMYAKQGQPVTLMQFTGLCDKNGKEIYEGDIIQWKEESIIFQIEWSQEDCGWICCRDIPMLAGSMNQFYLDHFEIIGDIHTTPELLK